MYKNTSLCHVRSHSIFTRCSTFRLSFVFLHGKRRFTIAIPFFCLNLKVTSGIYCLKASILLLFQNTLFHLTDGGILLLMIKYTLYCFIFRKNKCIFSIKKMWNYIYSFNKAMIGNFHKIFF